LQVLKVKKLPVLARAEDEAEEDQPVVMVVVVGENL